MREWKWGLVLRMYIYIDVHLAFLICCKLHFLLAFINFFFQIWNFDFLHLTSHMWLTMPLYKISFLKPHLSYMLHASCIVLHTLHILHKLHTLHMLCILLIKSTLYTSTKRFHNLIWFLSHLKSLIMKFSIHKSLLKPTSYNTCTHLV